MPAIIFFWPIAALSGTSDMTLSPRLQTPGWTVESVEPTRPVSAVPPRRGTLPVRWFFARAARRFAPGGRTVYQTRRRAQWVAGAVEEVHRSQLTDTTHTDRSASDSS